MIDDLKSYRGATKQVGRTNELNVPWLTKIPTHWSVVRSKALFTARTEKAQPGDEQLSATQQFDVIPQKEFESRVGRKVVRISQHLEKRAHVEKDDFVISMRSFQGGLERAWAKGCIRSSYVVLKPSVTTHVPYFAQLFKSLDYIRALQATSNFIRDGQDLNFGNFSMVDLPLPPFNEQVAMAKFLDHANGKIERAIRAKRKLIALLNEQKQAIIHRAVTRGLDPSVKLKPSGIPWLGDVPEQWEVRKLKQIARMESGSNITAINIDEAELYPVYGGNGLRGYTNQYTHDGDYALIGRQGALCGNVNFANGKFWASEHAVVPTLRRGVSVFWFGALIRTMNLRQYSQSAAQPGLSVEMIGNLGIAIPPSVEQGQIAFEITTQTHTLTDAITRAEREIDLLREYRTRLTADVVTGKLDVRDAVQRLPADTQEPLPPDDPLEDEISDEAIDEAEA